MSTPNPTHIIAAGMREVATEGREGTPGTREDGQLWGAFPNTMTLTDLAAHVVSKLTDAGYSIVKREALARAMYLDQARRHVHPADELSPEKMWDGNFFSRKDLWLAEADRILAAAAKGGDQ